MKNNEEEIIGGEMKHDFQLLDRKSVINEMINRTMKTRLFKNTTMPNIEEELFAGEMIPLNEGYELKLLKYKESEIGTKYKLDEIWNKPNNKFPILKRI